MRCFSKVGNEMEAKQCSKALLATSVGFTCEKYVIAAFLQQAEPLRLMPILVRQLLLSRSMNLYEALTVAWNLKWWFQFSYLDHSHAWMVWSLRDSCRNDVFERDLSNTEK